MITVAGMRYRQESSPPEDRVGYWRAERSGEIVGWAVGGLDAFASVRTAAFAGFGLEATETSSAVDPRTVTPPSPPPPGIDVRPPGAFADDPEPVFDADYESFLDEPGPSDTSGLTYDSWLRLFWDNPDCDLELGTVVLAAGVPVGVSFLNSDRATGRAVNGGTGVMPAFRGRGLGLLLKQHSLARAAAAGITKVITQNDETNAPMLAINARLGYEPFSLGHAWVLER